MLPATPRHSSTKIVTTKYGMFVYLYGHLQPNPCGAILDAKGGAKWDIVSLTRPSCNLKHYSIETDQNMCGRRYIDFTSLNFKTRHNQQQSERAGSHP